MKTSPLFTELTAEKEQTITGGNVPPKIILKPSDLIARPFEPKPWERYV